MGSLQLPPPNSKRYHFLIGTPGLLTIHTQAKIKLDDQIKVGNHYLKVTEVLVNQKSSYYLKHTFYELRFEWL